MHVYIHTCIHTYIHVCMHVYIHTYIHRYVYASSGHGAVEFHIYEWVMSRIPMSHVMSRSHVLPWVMSLCLIGIRVMTHGYAWHDLSGHVTYQWVMSHIWRSHGTYMNESFHAYQWVKWYMTYRQLRAESLYHVTHTHESWVMSRIPMSHVAVWSCSEPPINNESCHAYPWVMSPILMSHVTHTHESCDIWMSHVTHTHESCHPY